MNIKIKRVYEQKTVTDGYRILVDRLWPRGIKHENITKWMKEIAPSQELREWYHHDPKRWNTFKQKYNKELHTKINADLVKKIIDISKKHNVTLLYASVSENNNALVLLKHIKRIMIKSKSKSKSKSKTKTKAKSKSKSKSKSKTKAKSKSKSKSKTKSKLKTKHLHFKNQYRKNTQSD